MAPDPYRYFRLEARELLDQLAKCVLELEKAGSGDVSRLLRLAHTLKGAARVVKQVEIADLAHAVEDALVPHRDGTVPLPRARIDELLAALDGMNDRLARLPAPDGAAPARAAAGPDEPLRSVRAEVGEVDALIEGLGEAGVELASLRRSLASATRAGELSALLVDQLASPRFAAATAGPARRGSLSSAKALAGEINGLVASLQRNAANATERLDRELRQLRESAERLRLVPAATIFNSLERTARDVAHGLGKRVTFEAFGGEVRLDGHVLAAVQDALVQVVRNAVAHGIETERERQAAGKDAAGRVTLVVSRRRHRVTFACADDGRGVDLDAVRAIAAARGDGDSGDGADEAELMRLLLRGGITTSRAATEMSGRGVGLDVLRDVAERLGGDVAATTRTGAGTRIELSVPVSLASVEALVVEAGGELAAIPLDAVRRTRRIAPAELARSAAGIEVVHEERVIPYAPLARAAFGAGPDDVPAHAVTGVVVASGDAAVALGVDRLCGVETITLRPLPALAPAEPIVSGVHLDAEGNPRVVLDPERLAGVAWQPRAQGDASRERRPILVIDDSLTTRMLEQSILESAGYAVEVAASAEEGFDLARRNDYALYLVDVEMPGMDGFTFVERTRADPVLRQVPAILVTSREAPEDRRRGLEAGARAYIVKNEFDQIEFLGLIAELVRR
jgi:two-component system, chemotaxis family, sensor kinase CheA